jgi:23S rRNA (guanosine2251-2'-O)-methyltransferase
MPDQTIYGLHAVLAALMNPHRQVKRLVVSEDRDDARIQAVLEQAARRSIRVERLSPQALQQQVTETSHQGIIAIVAQLREYVESDVVTLLENSRSQALILILDGVTDPHNLGACLRSADAAGVDFVIIPKDKSATLTPVVSEVACGAAESVPVIRVTNLARSLSLLKHQGVWIYGAAGEASSSLYALDCNRPLALVMGAEGGGLRRLTRERCDELFHLPMHGEVSSLNVSVATGVSLYEVRRQRL